MFYRGINGLPNARNRNVLPSKLRSVELFKVEQMFFFTTAIIAKLKGGAINDKQPPLTTSVKVKVLLGYIPN